MQRDEDLSHVILDLTRRGRNRLKVCPVRTSSFQNSLANLSVKSITTKQNICAKTSLSPLSFIGDWNNQSYQIPFPSLLSKPRGKMRELQGGTHLFIYLFYFFQIQCISWKFGSFPKLYILNNGSHLICYWWLKDMTFKGNVFERN